jgi:hypothetical protein
MTSSGLEPATFLNHLRYRLRQVLIASPPRALAEQRNEQKIRILHLSLRSIKIHGRVDEAGI